MVFRLCGLSLYGQGDQNNNPDTVTDLKMTLKDEAHPDLFELSTDKDMDKSTSNLQAEDLDNVVEDNVDFVTAQNIINNDNRNGSSKILLNGNLKNSPNMKDTWINGNNDWAKSKKDIYDSSMTVINTDGFTKEYSRPQQAWSDHTLNNDKNQIVDNEVEENRNCCWICFFGRRKRNAVACSPLSDGESTDKTIVSEMWVDIYSLFILHVYIVRNILIIISMINFSKHFDVSIIMVEFDIYDIMCFTKKYKPCKFKIQKI